MKKVAVLVDGGYFRKKFQTEIDMNGPSAEDVRDYCHALLKELYPTNGELYRIFFYDAEPYRGSAINPISEQVVDFEATNTFKKQTKLLEDLRHCDFLAIRLGHLLLKGDTWQIKPKIRDQIIQKQIRLSDLEPDHIEPAFEQKGVDIKIGLDIATIAFKRLADAVVIISGDQDFIPAMKLAREEGLTVIFNSMGQKSKSHLIQHCDRFYPDFPATFKPRQEQKRAAKAEQREKSRAGRSASKKVPEETAKVTPTQKTPAAPKAQSPKGPQPRGNQKPRH